MVEIPVEILRTGSMQPLPERQLLQAGPLSAILEQGALRSIRLGGHEVLRGIYAAVRDRNWGTVEPRFTAYHVEQQEQGFLVTFTAEHVRDEIHFVWEGMIRGTSDGGLVFTFDGQASSTFYKNRIGFCVLHSMELAGVPVQIETPQGLRSEVFPARIAAHQPFKDIVALSYVVPELPGVTIDLRFAGDIFETEDQRNWTDASFKTYCTPLALPYPVEVAAGERVQQSITLQARGEGLLNLTSNMQEQPASIQVSARSLGPLPSLGFAIASDQPALTEQEIERLRVLRPGYLWLELYVNRPGWEQVLRQGADQVAALGVPLELSVICGDAGEGLDALVALLVEQHIPVARLFPFPTSSYVTTAPVASHARELIKGMGLPIRLGGGSRANFTELNRAELPLELLDLVGYPLNPQVHAFDIFSLVETLQAQAVTAENAQLIAGERALSVGPVTLKPRFNPVATGAIREPEPGELPENVDVRQVSLFAASWTVGSLHNLALAGAEWLTYYETVGWRGLMERMQPAHGETTFPVFLGGLFPLYHVFADIADFAGGELLALESTDALKVEALAVRRGERLLLLIANLTPQEQQVGIQFPLARDLRVRLLDERTAALSIFDGVTFRAMSQPFAERASQAALTLLPFAIARIDGVLEV